MVFITAFHHGSYRWRQTSLFSMSAARVTLFDNDSSSIVGEGLTEHTPVEKTLHPSRLLAANFPVPSLLFSNRFDMPTSETDDVDDSGSFAANDVYDNATSFHSMLFRGLLQTFLIF